MVAKRDIRNALVRPQMTRTRALGWQTIESCCRLMADHILSTPALSEAARRGIVPVVRGGLIPATILSHKLSLPIKNVIYPNTGEFEHIPNTNYLVVDDICDTGKTFHKISGALPQAPRVALLVKPEGRPYCDAAIMEVLQDTWVIFPWEEAL